MGPKHDRIEKITAVQLAIPEREPWSVGMYPIKHIRVASTGHRNIRIPQCHIHVSAVTGLPHDAAARIYWLFLHVRIMGQIIQGQGRPLADEAAIVLKGQ